MFIKAFEHYDNDTLYEKITKDDYVRSRYKLHVAPEISKFSKEIEDLFYHLGKWEVNTDFEKEKNYYGIMQNNLNGKAKKVSLLKDDDEFYYLLVQILKSAPFHGLQAIIYYYKCDSLIGLESFLVDKPFLHFLI